MFFIYNFLLHLFGLPYLFFAYILNPRSRFGKRMRLGFFPAAQIKNIKPVWIHASSVGEVKIALLIIEAFKKRHPETVFFLTTYTDTGYTLSLQNPLLTDLVTILPLDFPWTISPFIRKLNPGLLILIETEFWPNLLKTCHKNEIPVLVLNGRISSRTYKNYSRLKFFIKPILSFISDFSVRTLKEYEYLNGLGVSSQKIQINGNLKYEQVIQSSRNIDPEKIIKKLKINNDIRIIIFASTREGEEELLMETLLQLIKVAKIRIIIAPRHINRLEEIKSIFDTSSLPYITLSQLAGNEWPKDKILIVDSLGELFPLMSISYLTFVGGSLKPFGGQNLLEPAVFGQPVLFGKYISNFQAEADLLLSSGGGIMTEANEIFPVIKNLLDNPQERKKIGEFARFVVINNSGALEKSIKLMERYLP